MSFKTVLEKIGGDAKSVFSFLGSQKGQAVIGAGEAIVEAVYPGATGLINLGNKWLAEIVKTEALAAAAQQQNGSGPQKAAAVLTSVTPDVLAFAQANGLSAPTVAQITAANAALVAFANAFTPATTTAPGNS